MALFQKQPINYTIPIGYSFGAQSTRLVVGLGNPGKAYDLTRHNIGFLVLDDFAAKNEFPAWKEHKKFKAFITEKVLGAHKVILVKPTTYMNESGVSVQAIMQFYHTQISELLVIHDELSIHFGQIRMRVDGQAAGNNGVKSLIQHIGSEFGRVRIGINNDIAAKADASNFVLGKFTKLEQQYVPALCTEACGVITEWLYGGTLPHDTRSILIE
jgi:peptidyl-tRNA hydrolase, PTH1 family